MSSEFVHYTLADLDRRQAYALLTSIVVPRPIAWISTVSKEGVPNAAPFSYFSALSAEPMLIGVSIGARRNGEPKDSLRNIRDTGVFCVNVVTTAQLDMMSATAASLPPEQSEFESAQVSLAWSSGVQTPYVADCPVVMRCRLSREIDLAPAPHTLIIGEALAVRVRDDVLSDDPYTVDPDVLAPVGRLGGNLYSLPGVTTELERP